MNAEALKRRIRTLEAKWPDVDVDRSEIRAFLARLTDEELDRLIEIRQQIDEEQREPTEEEAHFLAELKAKYTTVAHNAIIETAPSAANPAGSLPQSPLPWKLLVLCVLLHGPSPPRTC